jgi:hypothetical protein
MIEDVRHARPLAVADRNLRDSVEHVGHRCISGDALTDSGVKGQNALGLDAIGDIARDCDDRRQGPPVAKERRGGDVCAERSPVLSPADQVARPPSTGAELGHDRFGAVCIFVRHRRRSAWLTDHLEMRPAIQSLRGSVRVRDHAHGVSCDDRFTGRLEQLCLEAYLPVRSLLCADVGDDQRIGEVPVELKRARRDAHGRIDAGARAQCQPYRRRGLGGETNDFIPCHSRRISGHRSRA